MRIHKNILKLLSLGLLLPFPILALELGAKMPNLKDSLKNVDGKIGTLQSFSGKKGTLVIFSCNHCPYAKAWEDRILAIGGRFSAQGIGTVIINSNDEKAYEEDSYENMKKRAKEKNYPVPYVVDATSNVARMFGATRTPEAFLFDHTHSLIYHGAIDDAQSEKDVKDKFLDHAITSLLSGKPATAKETKFIGCSIKFRS